MHFPFCLQQRALSIFRMAWPIAPKGCSHLLRGYSIRWFFFPEVLWFSLRTFPCEMRKLSQKHGICKISNAFPDSNFGISTGEHTPRPPRKWMLRRSSLAPSPKNAVRGPCIKRAWGINKDRNHVWPDVNKSSWMGALTVLNYYRRRWVGVARYSYFSVWSLRFNECTFVIVIRVS